MLNKALMIAAAVAARAAAAATAVVALAFALYAVLRAPFGPAWASAGVAGAAALIMGLGVLSLAIQNQVKARAKAREAEASAARLRELLKDKPFAAAGAALATALTALRDPKVSGFVLRTALEIFGGGRGKRRRG